MVVDNADDTDLLSSSNGISQYLPQSPNGLTLFTTRSRDVALALASFHITDPGEMNQQEARTLLSKSCIRKELLQNEMEIIELLDELAHIPLAVTQAAAYMNRNQVPIRKYLKLLRGAEQDMIRLMTKEFQDSTRYNGSQNTIASTWIISFEQIKEVDINAAELLSFVSCIEPKAIPQSIFPDSESEETEHALGTLCGYSFLTRRGDSGTFDIHSLVHMATQIWVSKNGLAEQTMFKVTNHLAGICPWDFQIQLYLWRDYMPHIFRILDQTNGKYCTNDRFALVGFVGRYLLVDRRVKKAATYLEEACQWRTKDFPEDSHFLEHDLACAYLDDRRLKEVIKIFEHVMAVRKNLWGEEERSRLLTEYELARAYFHDDRIKEEIPILEHVVSATRRTQNDMHGLRTKSEHALATAYLDDKRIKEATTIFESQFMVHRNIVSEDDISLLTLEYELLRAYYRDKRAKEAMELLEPVASSIRRTFHEEDMFRITVGESLAFMYFKAWEVGKAIEVLKKVVPVSERALAEDDSLRVGLARLLQQGNEHLGSFE
jgi:tetratricopeptide (TPR) repeat protein